ncbi:MAG: F0F1 ATP synthase subunit B [bacterium]
MEGLGIDWKILVGQLVNFIILLLILKRFAYKPFLSMMEGRRKEIEEGVDKSKEAEQVMVKVKEEELLAREKSKLEAREMMKNTETKVQEKTKELMLVAEKEREKILNDAKITGEKAVASQMDKKEIEMAETAITVASKFLGSKFDEVSDRKLIEKLISEIK